ncbi:MAG: carbon-nitrogen hydrolase [Actinobacteria bacterium]|nr:carbon-nitrogen hydrolase [Actinomycetota bacterium]
MRALLAQLSPRPADPAANAARVAAVLRDHPRAELAVFPELFLDGYDPACVARDALARPPAAVEALRTAAAGAACALIVGFAEPRPGGAVANAALCVDRDGTVAGVHRKTHLFGAAEQAAFEPGDALTLVRLAGRRVAPLICFEVELPELARAACRAGAELLVTIAANMAPYAEDHALASRSRALENGRPHLYVNRVGAQAGLDFVGGSRVVAADGSVVAAAAAGEALLEHEVPASRPAGDPLDYLAQMRDGLPVVAQGAAALP